MPKRYINGKWLDYRLLGRLDDKVSPIVLLHHGFSHADSWDDFPRRLHAATGRPILAYSREDCGRSAASDGPRRLDFLEGQACEVLPALLASFGCTRACLYGHGDGASIALIASARRPDLVEMVVAEAPLISVEPSSLACIRATVARFESDEVFRRNVRRGHRDGDRAFRLWSDMWLNPAFASWSAVEDLVRLHVPSLLLQGDADALGPSSDVDLVRRHSRGPVELRTITGTSVAAHLKAKQIPTWVADALSITRRQ